MEFVTIYENEEQKVMMPKSIADELTFRANNQKQLSQMEFEMMTQDVLTYVEPLFEIKGKRVISTSKAMILNRGKMAAITNIYDPLNDAILMVSEAFDLTENEVTHDWKVNMEILIKLYYKMQSEQKCVTHFYDVKTNGVSGFIALELQDNILILPLILNESGETQRLY